MYELKMLETLLNNAIAWIYEHVEEDEEEWKRVLAEHVGMNEEQMKKFLG